MQVRRWSDQHITQCVSCDTILKPEAPYGRGMTHIKALPALARCIAAVVALALFAACGGGSGGVAEGSSQAAPAAAAAASGLGDLQCNLLSDGFAAELLGEGFTSFDGSRDGLGSFATSECEWQHPDGLDGPTDFYSLELATVSAESIDSAVSALFAQPVPGLGDEGWRIRLSEATPFFTYHVKADGAAYTINLVETFGVDLTDAEFDAAAMRVLAEALSNR